MIIVGYPGIGKTWASRTTNGGIIDLDSVYFRDRDDDSGWLGGEKGLRNYIWLIKTLHFYGKTVLISSHKEVREALLAEKDINKKKICYICPDVPMKDAWLSRLYNRWISSTEKKDWFAYKRAIKNYENDVKDMISDRVYGVKVHIVSEEDLKNGLFLYLIRNRIIDYVPGMEVMNEDDD